MLAANFSIACGYHATIRSTFNTRGSHATAYSMTCATASSTIGSTISSTTGIWSCAVSARGQRLVWLSQLSHKLPVARPCTRQAQPAHLSTKPHHHQPPSRPSTGEFHSCCFHAPRSHSSLLWPMGRFPLLLWGGRLGWAPPLHRSSEGGMWRGVIHGMAVGDMLK